MPGAVVSAVGHGGGRVRVEPAARAAAGAHGQTVGETAPRLSGKAGKFLWTILVGNTLANFLILGWTVVKLHEWFLGYRAWNIIVFAVVVFLFYAFFDLLPKMLFRAYPNQSVPVGGARVPARAFRVEPAGSWPTRPGRCCAGTGGAGVDRAAFRQSRGNAQRSQSPGQALDFINERAELHQPGARFATFHQPPDCHATPRKR